MGRLVRSPKVAGLDLQIAGLEGVLQSGIAGIQAANSEPGDGYLERMVKYVPAEIIAFSMVINAILDQAMKSGGENAAMAGVPAPVIAAAALLIGCIYALVLLVCAAGRRRLGRQRGRFHDCLAVLGLSDGCGRLRQSSRRQPRGDPGDVLHRGERSRCAVAGKCQTA
jgi:hypothetical protein